MLIVVNERRWRPPARSVSSRSAILITRVSNVLEAKVIWQVPYNALIAFTRASGWARSDIRRPKTALAVNLAIGQALRFSSAQHHPTSIDDCRNARPH